MRCANCGATRAGEYCEACGQPTLPDRLTVGLAGRRLVAGATDLDRGFLHTAVSLFRNPARVVREYGRGRTVPYANPLKYFALALAALQLAAYLTGAIGDLASGLESDDPERAERLVSLLDGYFVLFAAPSVLVLILLQAPLLGRGRRNLAENAVFALFVCGQQALIWTIAMPVLGMETSALTVAALVAALLGTAGLYGWAAAGYFERSAWSATWRSALVLGGTMIVYLLLLFTTLDLLGFVREHGR